MRFIGLLFFILFYLLGTVCSHADDTPTGGIATASESGPQAPAAVPVDKGKNRNAAAIKVFDRIRENNEGLKLSEQWLKEAYSGLKIRKLTELPAGSYKQYSDYLYKGDIFIVVHPGFRAFFEEKAPLPPAEEIAGRYPKNNVVTRFQESLHARDVSVRVMVEQERLLRDFLEYMSTEKKLVLLLLPNDYRKNMTRKYVEGMDEYARYINDLTNMSASVLYLESQGSENGIIDEKDLKALAEFIRGTGAKNILLGGGFLGKCINDTYASLRKSFKPEEIFFVPEISQISPTDMVGDSLRLQTKNNRINFNEVMEYLRVTGMPSDDPEEQPRFKRLSVYRAYR